ncbi:DUF4954 family protein [Parabacteroides sp. Marseille-P3160]|uniref:DUF4954 family protein n=1 Tax=Parabacteroides sp. Marseille-P3160 TaxID=1917887 RepID=UPI0009BAD128|nr:DUF4954 family protein [Parabacteroides sp. Marseille-P3160]
MEKYRSLLPQEIEKLNQQGCSSRDWTAVKVHPEFHPEFIQHVRFSGEIRLGFFEKEYTLPGNFVQHSGIRNATLHNCRIGNNALIENVQNYVANYEIGEDVQILNIQTMLVEGRTGFGNGVEVSVLNETGGREVTIYDELSAHLAYIQSFYRHRPLLVQRIKEMIQAYVESHTSDRGTVGKQVRIVNTGMIRNVRIGDFAVIEGAGMLENGSINSNAFDPVHVGQGVIAGDFILSSGSHVEDGTMLKRCFVGQACHLGHAYSATDSLFFSNCQGENGEACAIFAGPYTVTHHKSTLLIAGMFSFMNAGSGSNQSNHMYKLGPIHQGVVERGAKTTSDSYILWPAKIGAFSLIMGRHYHHSDTSDLPFSYLIEKRDESVLIPGINLRSVGTIRDAQKFPKRDKRKDPHLLDQINFNLLSPYTIQKMFRAIGILKELQQTCGEASDTYTYQSCKIKSTSLKQGLQLYELAIHKFLGNSIVSRLTNCPCRTEEEIRDCLRPDTEVGASDWCDLAGLLAPRTEIDRLIGAIESGTIREVEAIQPVFETLHREYYSLEWTWAWEKIQSFYHTSLETITKEDIIRIVRQWKEAVVLLDRMIYEHTKKEFSLSSRISFGVDGSREDQITDFEQVRGVFEKNSFVESVLLHIRKKNTLGDELIARLG